MRDARVDLRKLRAAAGRPEQIASARELGEALVAYAEAALEPPGDGVVSFGRPGTPEEFFAIKLKDKYAYGALMAYACQAAPKDPEYGCEVLDLAQRALNHPGRRIPD